jgi:hypothetical protein
MMEWMSRILDGEMAGADEDFGSKVGQMWLNFVPSQNHKSTQHHPHHGPDDDPFKTINYHHLYHKSSQHDPHHGPVDPFSIHQISSSGHMNMSLLKLHTLEMR